MNRRPRAVFLVLLPVALSVIGYFAASAFRPGQLLKQIPVSGGNLYLPTPSTGWSGSGITWLVAGAVVGLLVDLLLVRRWFAHR